MGRTDKRIGKTKLILCILIPIIVCAVIAAVDTAQREQLIYADTLAEARPASGNDGDRVFLLSVADAAKKYFKDGISRRCKPGTSAELTKCL